MSAPAQKNFSLALRTTTTRDVAIGGGLVDGGASSRTISRS